jgi:hypothetical protein
MPTRPWRAAVAVTLATLVACAEATIPAAESRRFEASPAISTMPTVVRSVPELTFDLLFGSRPWELSDSALQVSLQAVNGRAFVGLKAEQAPTTASTLRTEAVRFRRTPIARATKVGISAADIALGMAAMEGLGARVTKLFDALGMVEIVIDPSLGPRLRSDPHVDFVEPVDTSDRVIGVELGSTSHARLRTYTGAVFSEFVPSNIDTVRAPLAWAFSMGSGARLLIIDTGHERGHVDLPLVPLANCSFGAFNGCDDGPLNPHGTQVSGVALALENATGILGVAPGVAAPDVYYWGVCGDDGHCDSDGIVDALNWSVNSLGSRGVISVSIAGTCSVAKALAVSAAYNAGHVIVAGVGNEGANSQKCIAAYSQVIAVAGISPDRTFAIPAPEPLCAPWPGSNWGDHVDVVAPYWAQSTTTPPSTYIGACGTSIASPTVAGVALLVRARYPYPNWEVRQRILDTAEDLGPRGWDDHFGNGLVRAHLAVAFDPPQLTPSVVSNKAKLTWQAVPFAVQYEVWVSITPACPDFELWATTSGTTYTAASPTVSSYYGAAPPPSHAALNSYVVAVTADGTSSKASTASFLTVSSNPPC